MNTSTRTVADNYQHPLLRIGLIASIMNLDIPFFHFHRDCTRTEKMRIIIEDDQKQHTWMSPKLKQYYLDGCESKHRLNRLLATTDTFKTSSETYSKYQIQGESFKIRQSVSVSKDTKNNKNPLIRYVETVCPGSPSMICESWIDSKLRMEWDSQFSSVRKVEIDDAFPNIFVEHVCSKTAAGCLVSPRDFVELISMNYYDLKPTGYQSVKIVSKSIVREDIPKQKGFVRGNTLIGGFVCETLSDQEIEEMELPKLKVPVSGTDDCDDESSETTSGKRDCEWTRIRYILQMELNGWLPSSLTNERINSTVSTSMRELRNFVMYNRLGLVEDTQLNVSNYMDLISRSAE